jgi:uncharacterized DUF497 family protein
MLFDWDSGKAVKNLAKHRVSFEEAVTVYADAYALTDPDWRHSIGEDREITIGRSNRDRILVVIVTERGDVMRIISARRATRREVRRYEEEAKRADRGE